ncbi:MAG TPA: MBL fold metallo-hydrolase [Mycobacteriales bacterium]|nr:MBL fold metallo-hydrolase [Mycobacteriales bacterium]
MKLTVIGCAGTFPGPDSACSSYLLEHDGFRLLIDAGNGSTGTLQRASGLLGIDAVLISHLHGDHYLDLVTYTYARRYHPTGRPACLPVYGPSDIKGHVASAFGRPVEELLNEVYDFRPIPGPGELEIGPFSLRLDLVNHPVETFGMRISDGTSTLAYSADTGACDELVELARGVDFFLCEASYLDGDTNPPDVHLTGREAAEHAARAEVGRLLLTHLVPWGDRHRTLEEAKAVYDGTIDVASSLDTFTI